MSDPKFFGRRRRQVRLRERLVLSLLWLFFLAPVSAQSPNGTINGLVLDPSGRAIAGADITVVNDGTGVQYPGKTNADGIYVVTDLPPGPYRLQVSKVGFKTLIKPDIVLNVQDSLAINFNLPIGALSETVTVEGGASMVNTTDGTISTVVDESYVRNTPLNGRSFQDLILLTPGTVTQSPQTSTTNLAGLGQMGEFSVNGQRTESNYYTVDGVAANAGAAAGVQMGSAPGASGSVATATALGTTQALVSVDDLQEFRVQSSTYSAEYGRNPGGQFAFETKSGTNQWHGSAYDYVRNGVFDANDWFNDYFGIEQPALRQNDFGGTLGGPVDIPGIYNGKDKTFFFVSYEGLRLSEPVEAGINYVPDAALRASVPAALDPVINAFPVPNGPEVGNGFAEFLSSWSNPSSLDSTSVRLDHIVNDKLRLFFRFSDSPSTSQARGTGAFQTPAELDVSSYDSRTYTGAANSAFTSRLSNEFRMNYTSNQVVALDEISSFGGSAPLELLQLSGLGAGADVSFGLLYGGYEIGIQQGRSSAVQRQWNLVDTASFLVGRHQFKFGVDYRRLTPIAIPSSPLMDYLYFSESAVESNGGLAIAATYGRLYPLYTNFSAFAEDEWRVSPRLSMSLGLRWELNPAPGVTQGLKPYTIQGSTPSTWTLAPEGTPLWRTTWRNFAPRLSAAYVLRADPNFETVVRGGFGVFYDTGQQGGSAGIQGPGFSLLNILPSTGFPLPASDALPLVNPPVPPYTVVYAFPANLQLPYTLQWNATIEQSLGKSQALSVSYVGSHASRLLKSEEYSGSAIGNPVSSTFLLYANGLSSDYDALQVQFRRRLTQGLTALASYTWSHCLDYGSQDLFLAYQRGNCDVDVRQNFSAAFSYDAPELKGNEFLKAVFNHWGLDDRFTARTGFPVTLEGNAAFDPTTGQEYNAGLDLAPGEPIYLSGANCASILGGLGDLPDGKACPGGRAINPNAFTVPSSGLGDAPRNFVRGFGAWQMDLAVRREFPVGDNLKLQFRAEAFNVFNHPNFGYINSNFGQATFGQATATLASSLGVLSPLYQMGGARSMQFALKIIF
jgi:hypothetical protein